MGTSAIWDPGLKQLLLLKKKKGEALSFQDEVSAMENWIFVCLDSHVTV